MATTPDLGIPLIATQQQQPNVTHNEALYAFQALQNGVINFSTSAPPGSPTPGDSYVIGPAPTGAWAGRANSIAISTDGGWRFVPGNDDAGTPIVLGARHHGLRIFNRADETLYVWSGTAWVPLATAAVT